MPGNSDTEMPELRLIAAMLFLDINIYTSLLIKILLLKILDPNLWLLDN